MENLSKPDMEHELPPSISEGYSLTGKIMMTAILILFAVVVFMVGLHIYARCYLLRSRRRQFRRRTHLIFSVESNNPNAVTVTAASHGLDAHALSSLPVFVYSSETHPEALECAVCLSEFEENEKGRFLPKCNHSFHIDCIDMWFHSHSTCPLCRSPAEPVPENKPDVVVSVGESAEIEPGSSTGLCPMCHHEEGVSVASSSSSSLGDRRKAVGMASVTIEVPGRTESEDELGTSSPASQGWKSPATRFLSRILSMNKKGSAVSPSSGMIGTSGGYGTDIECGRDELTQQRTRVQTPR